MKLISVLFIFSLTMSAAHISTADQINPNSLPEGEIVKEKSPDSSYSKEDSRLDHTKKPESTASQTRKEPSSLGQRALSKVESELSSAETNSEIKGNRPTHGDQQKHAKKDLKRNAKSKSLTEEEPVPEAVKNYSLIFKMMEKPWEMNGSGMMGVESLLPNNELKKAVVPMIVLPPAEENPEQTIKTDVKEQSKSGLKNQFLAADTDAEDLFDSTDDDFETVVLPQPRETFDEKTATQAVNSYPEGSVVVADLDESYDDETAADDSDAQSFLSDDASEIRDERPKGFTLSLGAARPWQWLTFSYAFQDNSVTLGGGKTTADIIAKSNVINLSLSHYAAGVERRWFPVAEVPFGLFYGVTVGQWQGTTRRGREQAKSYSAAGISSFAGLGLHIQRKSGWFWGANILGLSKTFVVSQTGNSLGGDVRGYFEDQKALGLPNISVGWFFP